MAHEILRFDHQQYLRALETLARRMEQPMADPATPATVLAYAHCRQNYDVVLDGMGADESIGAMPPRHVRLAAGWASLLPAPLRGGLAQLLRKLPGLAEYTPIVDFEHPADTMIRWRGFARQDIEELCGEPVSFADTQFYRTFARFGRTAHFERYSALLDAMPCERLNQATQITGAPARYPFWDRNADTFTRQLPIDFRCRPGEPKRILRALLARYVPTAIWDVPKHSFDFPLLSFLTADDFALVRRHLDRDRWQASGLLQPEGVAQLAQQFIAGDQRSVFRVWALIVLGTWLEAHPGLH
jgi:asparagine synthase (glutamine-hydrolysing)